MRVCEDMGRAGQRREAAGRIRKVTGEIRRGTADPAAGEEALWQAVVLYQEYPFFTASGLPFQYFLKKGRNGEPTRELWINRREKSKSLAWSSIRLVYQNVLQAEPGMIMNRPKALGDIRGVSYIYPLFWTFGLIRVPPETEEKMQERTDAEQAE